MIRMAFKQRCFLNATLLLGEESFYSVMSMAQFAEIPRSSKRVKMVDTKSFQDDFLDFAAGVAKKQHHEGFE